MRRRCCAKLCFADVVGVKTFVWRAAAQAGSLCHFPSADRRGFTFVEILACLVFLGILVPVVVEGLSLANRASVVAERSATAVGLAENKLGELMLNDAWATGETRGDFGKDWPDYRWESSQSTWEIDNLTVLHVDVFYKVQGAERSASLSTLMGQTTTQSSGTQSSGQQSTTSSGK